MTPPRKSSGIVKAICEESNCSKGNSPHILTAMSEPRAEEPVNATRKAKWARKRRGDDISNLRGPYIERTSSVR
jgi:hypothetical protein